MRTFVLLFLAASFSPLALKAATAHSTPLSDGIRVSSAGVTVQITALRDDVLRVRATHTAVLPEDASWAVLPSSRTASVKVIADPNGFHTAVLKVAFDSTLRLTISDLAGNILQQDAEPITWHGTGFRIAKQKDPADHFFGLGDKPGPLDRVGQAFTMWNTDTFGWQESTDPIYKSIPFFIDVRAGRALGVLFDNTWRTWFDFGKQDPKRYSFSAPNGPVDYYILYGPEPKQVVEAYAWLTGPTPLPPMWSLGFQQSRYSYYPQSQVEEVAAKLRADHIPADAIYLDIDFQFKNRPFTVDTANFPDFAGLIRKLSAAHLHTVAITDLHIADVPNAGYTPYDTGKAGDHFVKRNGQDYVGVVWPGPSVFPDFTREDTRKWW